MSRIAWIGLGAMGVRMAGRLLDVGHTLTVFNRDPQRSQPFAERGAAVAKSPRAAAQDADVVFGMVSDDQAAHDVWLAPDTGALAALGEDALAIDCSTLSPGAVESLQQTFRDTGRRFLFAPVLGSRPQAEAGQLVILAGGDAADIEAARPWLDVIGGRVEAVGHPADAARLKLAVNALLAVQTAAYAELLGALTAAGHDPAATERLLTSVPVASPALKAVAAKMTAGTFAPNFPIALVAKDLAYAAAMSPANNNETLTPSLLAATRDLFAHATDQGHGNLDLTGVLHALADSAAAAGAN
ncbi:MAG: NAD(P)-dependent oxidoreductase [Planctomycetota bacterium]